MFEKRAYQIKKAISCNSQVSPKGSPGQGQDVDKYGTSWFTFRMCAPPTWKP